MRSSLVRKHFTTYLIFDPTIKITMWKSQVETVDILSLVTNEMKFSSESWLFWIFNEANISANLWLKSSSLWQARISSGLQSSDPAILEFYVLANISIWEISYLSYFMAVQIFFLSQKELAIIMIERFRKFIDCFWSIFTSKKDP